VSSRTSSPKNGMLANEGGPYTVIDNAASAFGDGPLRPKSSGRGERAGRLRRVERVRYADGGRNPTALTTNVIVRRLASWLSALQRYSTSGKNGIIADATANQSCRA
jgi:hypothetical protein